MKHAIRSLAVVILASAAAEGATPARLQLRVQSSTLRVGESTRLDIAFLDRAYSEVPNDRERVVSLEPQGLGGSAPGSISPARITVPAGARSLGVANYVAKGTGRVVIRAASDGLASADAVLVVVTRGASFLSQLLLPTAEAQGQSVVDLLPRKLLPLPANGVSRAKLYLVLDRPVSAGQRFLAHLTTNPPVKVLYGGVEKIGFTQITIPEQQAVSEEIQILSSQEGRVSVTARALPAGAHAETRLDFVGPRPTGIAFDFDEQPAIRPYAPELPVRVHLIDQDGARIASLTRNHPIECKSSTDADVVSFEPPRFVLTPARPAARTTLRVDGVPRRKEVRLSAEDRDGDLEPGNGAVTVESSVHRVKLIGPTRVYSGKSYAVKVRLVDADGAIQRADWDREIRLSAPSGKFDPDRVTVAKDKEEAIATYRTSDEPGPVTLQAEGRLLESGELKVTTVASPAWLFGFAAFGGVLGGLARYVYKVQSLALLPRRVHGKLEPGIVFNGLLSALVGIVVFQAAEYGIRNPAWELTGIPENGALAFFLGVLGGFAGVLALDRFVEFILPASRETAKAVPEA